MQDIHSIAGGGGGRIFGSTGDRRLRPHHHHHHGHHNHHQAALKCPRCDSLNTKFCYYNNYNLSQPRHFCKSCRRYWTKGGVLRNVPVGGGCRKSKRSSKPKPSPPSLEPQPAATATATASATANQPRERKSSSHSSSESSSLTATTTAIATEAVSATSSISQSNNLLSIQDYSNSIMSQGIIINPNEDSGYEKRLMEQTATECGLFTDIGSFSTLISSSSVDAQLSSYGFNAVLSQPTHQGQVPHDTTNTNDHHHQWPHQMASLGGFNMEHHHHHHHHHNVLVDLPSSQNDDSAHRSSAGGFGSLDWQTNGDEQGLFDIPNAVDQGYWGQHQWSHDAEDQDQPGLYLP